MKVNILEQSPFIEDYRLEKVYVDGKEIEYNIKNSKSFVIIKNNLIEYVEKHKVPFGHLQQDDNPVINNPFAGFKILKLTKDTFKILVGTKKKAKLRINKIDTKDLLNGFVGNKKLEIIYEARNMYRTLAAMSFLLFLFAVADILINEFSLSKSLTCIIIELLLIALFTFAFIEQNNKVVECLKK